MRLDLSKKLPLLITVLALVAAVAMGMVGYIKSSSELSANAETKLEGLMQARQRALSNYLNAFRQDMAALGDNKTFLSALTSFASGIADFSNPTDELQKLYITDNKHKPNERYELGDPQDGSLYSIFHADFQPWFRKFLIQRGYKDILMIGKEGLVVYTVAKLPHFATSLKTGAYKDTALANLYKTLAADPKPGRLVFADFSSYAADGGNPAAFIGTPVIVSGEVEGFLVFQISADAVNDIMSDRSGLGETGETYVVGSDHLMRSDSRFSTDPSTLKMKVDTVPVNKALAGESGVMESENYTGKTVVSSYVPFEFMGAKWAVIAEAGVDEIFAPVTDMGNFMLLGGLVVLIIIGVVGTLFARAIVKPIVAMTEAIGGLAEGRQNVEIPALNANDEVGDIARSLVEIHETGTRAARIQAALDNVSSPVILVDNNHSVLYANNSWKHHFDAHAAALAKDIPGFPSGSLEGVNFDSLHNQNGLRQSALQGLSGRSDVTMEAGGRTIDLTANPVLNQSGDRLGTVIEAVDRTSQLAIESEVANLVKSAVAGDFTQRLETDGKEGFMLTLSEGVNELVGTVQNGLDEVVKVLSSMAQGNLTERMVNQYQGAFDRVKQDSNAMADKLSSIVGEILETASNVQGGAAEIAEGSNDLAGRTEQQASSLEQTAAAMEELTATVRQNSDSAQQANQLASAARDMADRGGEVVASAVEAMDTIEGSSSKISEIVNMIDEIAFQTNLLALNAAVEAARAGEAGKGFAVVAQEVRSLAQRSAEASKEISDLIANSSKEVSQGVGLVNQTGETLTELVGSIKKVADIVAEIAAASTEQANGLDEVNTAVTNMDEMTQQNAALVEETTAAATSMTDQATDLVDLVQFFNTGKEFAPTKKPAPKPAASHHAGRSAPARPAPKRPAPQHRETAVAEPVAVEDGFDADDEDWQEF